MSQLRGGVRRHLPLEVHLDPRHTVDHARVLEVAAAERALGQLVPAEVDVLGARAELVLEPDLVELEVEAVGHEPHGVLEHPGVLLEHARDGGVLDRPAEADLDPGVDRVVAGHVDGLDAEHVLDLGDVGRVDDRQDLRQARVHAGAVERGAAALARRLDHLATPCWPDGCGWLALRWWPVIQSAVVTMLMPGLEDRHVQIDVGEHAVERHAVGLGRDDLLDGAGRDHTDRVEARRSRRRPCRPCPASSSAARSARGPGGAGSA